MSPRQPEPVDAVVFDVDGTLVDSERDGHRVAFNAAFESVGLSDRWDVGTYGVLLDIAGGLHRLTYWFERNGRSPGEARRLAEQVHRAKTEVMHQLVTQARVPARPGAQALVETIRAHGVPVHVATTGTRTWVEPLLDQLFGDVFAEVVTGTEVGELKPSPAVYQAVLQRAGCLPGRTVAVEDSENGLLAARAAGLRCVVTSNDYTHHHDFTGAALLVRRLDDPSVISWFERRLSSPRES